MSINDDFFNKLRTIYREKWFGYSNELNLKLDKVNYIGKRKNEKQLDGIIDALISKIKEFPDDELKRVQWKNEANKMVESIFKEVKMLKLGLIDENMKRGFIDSTYNFVRKCRSYDEAICFEDIGQALRNVWIVNILQKIFGKAVEYNDAVFAYSMLYPYTDNFLDDVRITTDDKKKFNNEFSVRINGEDIKPSNVLAGKSFDMISIIENKYAREDYEGVYMSLNYIQEGQIKSLSQQNKKSNPYEQDVLDISIEKGGASVLVDGYLIDGNMDFHQTEFSFGYGFLLQLCDDLQDVKVDYENNHMTIMSQLCGKYNLDQIVNKLINFTYDLIRNSPCFKCENEAEVKELIIENILLMIVTAVGMNSIYFSKEYASCINEYIPFRIKYIRKMTDSISTKFKNLEPTYGGLDVEEILYNLFY